MVLLLLPQLELLAGNTLMLRRPLQEIQRWVQVLVLVQGQVLVQVLQVICTGCRCSSYSWDSPSSDGPLHGEPRRSTGARAHTHTHS